MTKPIAQSFDQAIGNKPHYFLDPFIRHLLSVMDNDDFLFFGYACDFPGFAGYHPNYNGKIYVAYSLPSLFHEIAHLVEIDNERYLLPDFGLGGKATPSQRLNKKFMIKASAREERVIAIQKVINCGNNPEVNKSMSIVNQNPFYQELFNKVGFPFNKFQNFNEVKDWAFHIFEKATKVWTRDKIEFEFFKRVEVLRNNIHTNNLISA